MSGVADNPCPFRGRDQTVAGLAQNKADRDGLIVLIGALVSAVAIAVASVATWAAILGLINYFAS